VLYDGGAAESHGDPVQFLLVATEERDSEGFPVCNEDSVGSLYTDEFEVVYVCELIEGLGYSWRSLGPAVEPPREG